MDNTYPLRQNIRNLFLPKYTCLHLEVNIGILMYEYLYIIYSKIILILKGSGAND